MAARVEEAVGLAGVGRLWVLVSSVGEGSARELWGVGGNGRDNITVSARKKKEMGTVKTGAQFIKWRITLFL